MFVSCYKKSYKKLYLALVPWNLQSFCNPNAYFWMFPTKPILPSLFRDFILEWCWSCLGGFCKFHFNYCGVIESLHSYIPRIHVIIVTSSSLVKTFVGPILLLLVFPFKWMEKELSGMFQNLLAFFNECVPLSIASMVVSNVWSIHFPLYFVSGALLTIWHGCLLSNASYGGIFSLSKVAWSITTFCRLWGTLNIMMSSSPWPKFATSKGYAFQAH
jgi:hypothetical protein